MPLTSGLGLPPLHAYLISSAGRNTHPTNWAPSWWSVRARNRYPLTPHIGTSRRSRVIMSALI